MFDPAMLIEALRWGGIPGLLIMAWAFHLRYEHKQRQQSQEAERRAFLDSLTRQQEFFERVLAGQAERDARVHQILDEIAESHSATVSILARLEHKIDTHNQCPIIRRGGGLL